MSESSLDKSNDSGCIDADVEAGGKGLLASSAGPDWLARAHLEPVDLAGASCNGVRVDADCVGTTVDAGCGFVTIEDILDCSGNDEGCNDVTEVAGGVDSSGS